MDNQKLRVVYLMVHPFSHIFATPTLVNEFSTHNSVPLSWLFCSFDLFFYSEANSLWAKRLYFHNKSISISQTIPLLLFFLFLCLDPSWPFVLTHTHTHTHSREFELFIYSVVPNTSKSHGLKHTRLPCLSLPPGACSNLRLLNWWCHWTISSSVIPFSSCPQSFPTSGSFPVSRLFTSGAQSIGASASALVLPMNI